jgi:hypothetical protein
MAAPGDIPGFGEISVIGKVTMSMKGIRLAATALMWASCAMAQVCHLPNSKASPNQSGVVMPIELESGGAFVPVILNDGSGSGRYSENVLHSRP